jgi:hypothetical protein
MIYVGNACFRKMLFFITCNTYSMNATIISHSQWIQWDSTDLFILLFKNYDINYIINQKPKRVSWLYIFHSQSHSNFSAMFHMYRIDGVVVKLFDKLLEMFGCHVKFYFYLQILQLTSMSQKLPSKKKLYISTIYSNQMDWFLILLLEDSPNVFYTSITYWKSSICMLNMELGLFRSTSISLVNCKNYKIRQTFIELDIL